MKNVQIQARVTAKVMLFLFHFRRNSDAPPLDISLQVILLPTWDLARRLQRRHISRLGRNEAQSYVKNFHLSELFHLITV